MTSHGLRVPFRFDPLIAEAKRRMLRRRSLLALLGLLILGACVLGVVLANRPPARPTGIARFGVVHRPRFEAAPGWYVGSVPVHACGGVSRWKCVAAQGWA